MALHLFAMLAARDYASSRAWYDRLLGEPEFLAHETEAVWTLAGERSIAVHEDARRAGHGEVTILVDDLDAQLGEIEARGGLAPDHTETYSNGVRKAIFRDPDGNELGFAGAPAET